MRNAFIALALGLLFSAPARALEPVAAPSCELHLARSQLAALRPHLVKQTHPSFKAAGLYHEGMSYLCGPTSLLNIERWIAFSKGRSPEAHAPLESMKRILALATEVHAAHGLDTSPTAGMSLAPFADLTRRWLTEVGAPARVQFFRHQPDSWEDDFVSLPVETLFRSDKAPSLSLLQVGLQNRLGGFSITAHFVIALADPAEPGKLTLIDPLSPRDETQATLRPISLDGKTITFALDGYQPRKLRVAEEALSLYIGAVVMVDFLPNP